MFMHCQRLAFVLLLLSAGYIRSDIITSKPFLGVTYFKQTVVVPRPLAINVIEVDLGAPGIRFQLTEPNGPLAGDTTFETTRSFVNRVGAQVGVNIHFYGTALQLTDPIGIGAQLNGLAVSNGNAYVPWDTFFRYGLNLAADNTATFINRPTTVISGYETTPTVPLYNAFAGNERILVNGVTQANDNALQPRTAIGLTSNDRLLLFTVDGRQAGISEGMTTIEVANIMRDFYGAVDAINVDGGGSTALVLADPVARVVNVPVGVNNTPGSERSVGSSLAVFAQPIPETRTYVLIAIAASIVLIYEHCRKYST
jgi:hypothetical protein